MFERLTDDSRKVLVAAKEEAQLLLHSYIDTEHLLLGILRQPGTRAANAFLDTNATLESVRRQVEVTVGKGRTYTEKPPFTPRAKKVLDLALREALPTGESYIGPEHILLGILREGEGVAVRVLTVDLGLDMALLRSKLPASSFAAPPNETSADAPDASQEDAGARVVMGGVISIVKVAANEAAIAIDLPDDQQPAEIVEVMVRFRTKNGVIQGYSLEWPLDD